MLHLGEKITTARSVGSFKLQTYIPKSNIGSRLDQGLYLMRHMETYKGKRVGYKSSMTEVSSFAKNMH